MMALFELMRPNKLLLNVRWWSKDIGLPREECHLGCFRIGNDDKPDAVQVGSATPVIFKANIIYKSIGHEGREFVGAGVDGVGLGPVRAISLERGRRDLQTVGTFQTVEYGIPVRLWIKYSGAPEDYMLQN